MPGKIPSEFLTTFETYTRVGVIGEGGSGYVFKVEDGSGSAFALKALKAQWVTETRRKRFKNEIHFCQGAFHDNIIKVIDHGVFIESGNNIPFYLMPLYAYSLRKLISDKLSYESILSLFSQILDGVEAAHLQGVIHRDLKPENILLDETATRLVIADFGIAQFQQEDLYTAVETKAADRLANFNYAAPEQRQRGVPVDLRADIYALGLILNELFTHEVPHGTGFKLIESVSSESSYLDDLVSIMIRQSPSDRPESIGVIKAELIARGKTFVAEQKLSQVKKTVIPQSELDDPLLSDPVEIIDFEWERNTLTIILSRPVTAKWVSALKSMGSYSSQMGRGPEMFNIREDRAIINAQENHVQAIINYFKGWLPIATKRYEQMLKKEHAREQQQKQAELQARIQEEEAKARLRRNIKF